MKIHIKKINLRASSNGAKWTLFTLAYYMFSYALVYTLNMPRALLYGGDILNLVIFILALRKKKSVIVRNPTIMWMILFSIVGISSALINMMNVGLLIWGLRNNLRFFTFFYACVTLLEMQDIKLVLDINKLLFWISLPLCTIERFFVSYSSGTIVGDMIGGIFWNFPGSNTPLNVIIVLHLLQESCNYFDKKIKNTSFIITSGAALYMAALAELKVFLFEFIIILLFTALWSRKSWKTIVKILVGVIIFYFFISYFIGFNARGSDYASNYTLMGFMDYATRDSGYNGINDLNRLTGISTIATTIFNNDWIANLIGIGLGNAEYTNFFVSNFYRQYPNISYQWFHDIWLYIETGTFGLVTFVMIYVSAYRKARQVLKTSPLGNFVRIAILLMLVLFIYNISMRTETTGFLLYLVLAIPYIVLKERKINDMRN